MGRPPCTGTRGGITTASPVQKELCGDLPTAQKGHSDSSPVKPHWTLWPANTGYSGEVLPDSDVKTLFVVIRGEAGGPLPRAFPPGRGTQLSSESVCRQVACLDRFCIPPTGPALFSTESVWYESVVSASRSALTSRLLPVLLWKVQISLKRCLQVLQSEAAVNRHVPLCLESWGWLVCVLYTWLCFKVNKNRFVLCGSWENIQLSIWIGRLGHHHVSWFGVNLLATCGTWMI